MTDERWRVTQRYAEEVFGAQDGILSGLAAEAAAAGLPTWSVSAHVGRFLMMLASLTVGRLALEIGTLGGYSAIWITRGLAPEGRLITIEYEERHSDFAERQFIDAGFGDRIDARRGAALDLLPSIAAEVGPESLDFVFIDGDKAEYPAYFVAVRDLIAIGGLLVVDNVFGTGSSWIDDVDEPGMRATDAMNRAVAGDPGFVATALSAGSGLLVAKRV